MVVNAIFSHNASSLSSSAPRCIAIALLDSWCDYDYYTVFLTVLLVGVWVVVWVLLECTFLNVYTSEFK